MSKERKKTGRKETTHRRGDQRISYPSASELHRSMGTEPTTHTERACWVSEPDPEAAG